MSMAIQALEMTHDTDPKEVILLEFAGVTERVTPLLDDVLVAVYERPTKTKGGVFMTSNALSEDKYQGKVGLILSMGPLATSDENWGGQKPEIGDWVAFPVNRSWPVLVGKRILRFIPVRDIRAILTDPDAIY